MDLNNFDKQIKSSLENLEAPFDGSSWLSLEKRLNAAISEENPPAVEPIDLVVKRGLEKFEAPYLSSDWGLMVQKLNQVALQRRVRWYKAAEAAIIILLIANVEGFLGGIREVVKPSPAKAPVSNVPMASAHRKHSGNSRSAKSTQENSTLGQLAQQVVELITTPFQPVESQQVAASVDLPSPVSSSVLDASVFYHTSGTVRFDKLTKLPASKPAVDFAWNNIFEIIPGVSTPEFNSKNHHMYAASFGSFDKNKFSAPDYQNTSNGYGGGIAVGYRKGAWGFETGLAYSQQQFAPKKEVDVYAGTPIKGYVGAYINDVQADIFCIPAKVTRRIAKMGPTSLHATAGISAHVATAKQFAYKTVVYPPSSPGPTDPIDPAQYPIPKSNHEGYLEGGALKGNVYASADMGLRLEHKVGKRYVAFVEPGYRVPMSKGYGPGGEKISSFSFQAGVMAAL